MPAISASIIFPASTIDSSIRVSLIDTQYRLSSLAHARWSMRRFSCNALPHTKIKIGCYIVTIAHLVSSVLANI